MTQLLIVVVAYMVALQTTAGEKPRVASFFSRVDDGPAFLVECRNNTGRAVSSGSRIWSEPIRIDGVVPPPPAGRIGPGLSTEIKPGELWSGIIVFRQSEGRDFPPPKFGAHVRAARVLSLAAGRHTLAVQCDGVWSDDLEFYWDAGAP